MSGDPQQAAQQAGITGTESEEILAASGAHELLQHPTFARALRDLAAYYAQKQLEAQADVDACMRWQLQRVALADLELTLRAYLETGAVAQARVGRFRAILERLGRTPHRLDRFKVAR